MTKKSVHYTGQRFGFLVLVREVTTRRWICKCDCGTEREFPMDRVRAGLTVSCGCYRDRRNIEDNPFNDREIQQKIQLINIERYGFASPFGSQEVQGKVRQTNLDRYGVENPFQSKEVQEKIKQTNVNRYGVDNPAKSSDVQLKIISTSREKYGTDRPSQSSIVKEVAKNTFIEHLGVDAPQRCSGVRAKTIQTNLDRYGVMSTSQNREIALKQARTARRSCVKLHWRTGEELVCVGSYESKVVDYLNSNKVNFQWQPMVFQLSTGRSYRPDLYLVDVDMWIEIKGYFRGLSREKWDEFHERIKPNSELWDEKKLKSMGILRCNTRGVLCQR